jgi:microsomal dipeptidase-like Zn-dependent dipeptidase
MAHMGYGGHLLWGEPSGPIEQALRPCNGTNHGGDFNILGFDISEKVLDTLCAHEGHWGRREGLHPRHGYPDFVGWPVSATLCHQQMHVDWVRRAYEGGLRLMSVLAVNTRLLAWLMEARRESWDDDQIRSQLAAVRALAAAPENRTWMEIAESADHAAAILAQDKLAIVLGVEVDQIELLLSHDPAVLRSLESEANAYLAGRASSAPSISRLAAELHDLGVRQVTPIHLANNVFGGAALYLDATATNTHWLTLWADGEGWGSTQWPDVVEGPDDVDFHLQWFQVPANRKTWFLDGPLDDAVQVPAYANPALRSHANALGLTNAGVVLMLELWRQGILVDIDHMSAAAAETALNLAERSGVPMVASHCTMRAAIAPVEQQLVTLPGEPLWWRSWDGHTPDTHSPPGFPMLRHEGMRTDEQLRRIYALGGMVAVATRQPTTIPAAQDWFGTHPPTTYPDRTIPAGWTHYLHALGVAGSEASIAFGTDMNGMNGAPAPLMFEGPSGSDFLLRHQDADIYDHGDSRLTRSTTGARRWDIGSDGLAHIGLLPDLLQRWRREGIGTNQLAPLMRSADGYVAAMQRAEQAAAYVTRP